MNNEKLITKIISDLKLGSEKEISLEEAKELLLNTEYEHEFSCLNQSTNTDSDDSVGFEVVQNRAYTIKKIGRKGTVIYKGSEYECKVKEGTFSVEMTWDYRHPNNFAQNRDNLSRFFIIGI